MSIFSQNKSFYGQPFRLTPKQQGDPMGTLKELLGNFRLEEIRESLATLLEVAITSENLEYQEPTERANAIYTVEQVEMIVEAAYLLQRGLL